MKFQTEKLREAQGRAQDLGETIAPHVDHAVETARTVALEQVVPRIVDAAEQARDQAQKHVVPKLLEARDQAIDQATPVAKEARRRGRAAARALKGEEPVKKHRVRKIALLALITGAGVFVAKTLQGKSSGAHSAPPMPTPTPRPTVAPDPVEAVDDTDPVAVAVDDEIEPDEAATAKGGRGAASSEE